jgi:two-component SAPR family response regulator
VRWNRSKAKELFAYLMHYAGQKLNKYRICEDLWPDCESRKSLINLQTAVYSLRKSLWAAGADSIRVDFSAESYELQQDSIFCDAVEFQRMYERFLQTGDIAVAKEAVALYAGEYADGGDWRWAQLTAEAFSQIYARLLRQIAQDEYTAENWGETGIAAEKLLQIRPFDGDMQRMLLDAAWRVEGMSGLATRVHALQRFCREEYDTVIEPEAAAYCREKGLELRT